jgi:FdhD protein
MMEKRSVATVSIRKVSRGKVAEVMDLVAAEEPMEIQLLYNRHGAQVRKSVSVTMRTPGNDEELAIGFLFTEGIIHSHRQLFKTGTAPGNENIIVVSLSADASPVLNGMERNFYTTSACGICGKASIDAIKTVSPYKEQASTLKVTADILYNLPEKLLAQQEVFDSTGGLHAAALFDQEGTFLLLREDVGRHNALDKLIGAAFLKEELPLANVVLMLSGRASFELVQKAAMAGIKIIAAVGAPSSLAVSLAEESGITLIGFLRKERFNIYSGATRII